MLPLLIPQVALFTEGETIMAEPKLPTVTDAVLVQLLSSVTVTVYVPAARLTRGLPPTPAPVHAYVRKPTPPVTVSVILPLLALQVALPTLAVMEIGTG